MSMSEEKKKDGKQGTTEVTISTEEPQLPPIHVDTSEVQVSPSQPPPDSPEGEVQLQSPQGSQPPQQTGQTTHYEPPKPPQTPPCMPSDLHPVHKKPAGKVRRARKSRRRRK